MDLVEVMYVSLQVMGVRIRSSRTRRVKQRVRAALLTSLLLVNQEEVQISSRSLYDLQQSKTPMMLL